MSKINRDFTIKQVLKFIKANMQSIKTLASKKSVLIEFKQFLNKLVDHFAQVKMAKLENKKDN